MGHYRLVYDHGSYQGKEHGNAAAGFNVMPLSRNRLYVLLAISCMAGYSWVCMSYRTNLGHADNEVGVCIIKHVTHIPCPSCGSTRSLVSLLKGNFLDALYWNPIGLILLVVMFIAPLWIIYDCFLQKDSLFNFYRKTEQALQQRKLAIPAILLVLVNWLWNIYKGV
ncbi:MAG: DUF2752 domain-containing protein [Daejeonella sp.]